MDSNLLSGHSWEMRRPIVPPAISPKPIKKMEPKPPIPATGGGLISRKYFSQTNSIPTAKPLSSPVTLNSKPIAQSAHANPFSFSGKQIIRNISNTRNTRYQMDKQLRGIFNKSSTRSKVVKAFSDRITGSGKLSLRDAKQATYELRKQGFSRGEINRVRRSMNF